MPNDIADWTQAADIQAGSVNITAGTVDVQNTPNGSLDTRQPQSLLAGPVSVARDGASHSVYVGALPPATHAVAVVIGGIRATQINVFGLTTNIDWAQFPTLGNQAPPAYVFKVLEAIDNTVGVDVTLDSAGGSVNVWVAAVLDTLMVTNDDAQAGLMELAGHLTTNVNTVLNVKAEQGVLIGGRLATAHTDAVPAPWEAANQLPLSLGVAVAASSNVNLITAPPVGQRIYLHGLMWQFTGTGTANGSFQTATGTDLVAWNDSIRGPFTVDFRGAPLPAAVGLRLHNATANGSQFFNGVLTYSIAA